MAIKFLKTGEAAAKAFQKADAEAAARTAAASMSDEERAYRYRFWMPVDADARITFLDGELNPNGVLDETTYTEHQVPIGNDWRNFYPCVSDQEPCPLCVADNKSYYVAVFSIIDHSEWVDKQGAVHKNERKLYAVKRDTVRILRKMSLTREGLRGCTFDVSRTGDRSPNVGSHYDFIKKWEDMAAFGKEYNVKDTSPLNYGKVVKYRTATELLSLGVGIKASSIGGESSTVDVSKEL